MSIPNWPLPPYHRLVIFLAGKLAQRDRRWWRRVSWIDRLDEAKDIMDEWVAIALDKGDTE